MLFHAHGAMIESQIAKDLLNEAQQVLQAAEQYNIDQEEDHLMYRFIWAVRI